MDKLIRNSFEITGELVKREVAQSAARIVTKVRSAGMGSASEQGLIRSPHQTVRWMLVVVAEQPDGEFDESAAETLGHEHR